MSHLACSAVVHEAELPAEVAQVRSTLSCLNNFDIRLPPDYPL
jgi:hypothetical protein